MKRIQTIYFEQVVRLCLVHNINSFMDVSFYYTVKKRFCVTDPNEYPVTNILSAKRPLSLQSKGRYVHDK